MRVPAIRSSCASYAFLLRSAARAAEDLGGGVGVEGRYRVVCMLKEGEWVASRSVRSVKVDEGHGFERGPGIVSPSGKEEGGIPVSVASRDTL